MLPGLLTHSTAGVTRNSASPALVAQRRCCSLLWQRGPMDCRSHAASAASQAVQVRYSQERSNSEHIRLLKRTDFASSLLKRPYGPHTPCTASLRVPILQDPALLHNLGLLPSAHLSHLSVPTPGQPDTSGVLGHLQLEKPERR